MAIPKFEADLKIISKLGDYPGSDNGLDPSRFKEKFDESGLLLQDYINNVLIPNFDMFIDVDALLNGILDTTLTKEDKAAAAKTVGDALKKLTAERRMDAAKIFDKALRGGDFVVSGGQNFAASFISSNTVRVSGGVYIAQGNLIEMNLGSYADVTFESGLGGTYRNDLICGRVSRDTSGNETRSIVLIKGTPVSSSASDPAYNTGDLNTAGAVIRDTPLYRLKMSGVTPTLIPLFSAQQDAQKLLFTSVSVPVSAFSEDTTYDYYGYRASIALKDVKAGMIPEVVFGLSDAVGGNFAPVAETYDGGVYIYAVDIPESAVTIPTIMCWRGA